LTDDLPAGSRVALDSNVLIYFIEEHPQLGPVVDLVFQMVEDGTCEAVVSVVSLVEVLVAPLRAGQDSLVTDYRALLVATRGLTLVPVTTVVAEHAARIRAERNLRLPDAVIAATAVTEGCTHLVANDAKFAQVAGLQTLIVSDYLD
jgi:predicted nucleic acid-binding protein